MDIFKLLSRATNLSKSANRSSDSPQAVLPSAGQNSTPQLFGGEEGTNGVVLGKRKRGRVGVHTSELGLPVGNKLHNESPGNGNGRAQVYAIEASDQNGHVSEGELEADECRKILKSHKVKISALGPEAQSRRGKPPGLWTRPLGSFRQLQRRYKLGQRLFQGIARQGYTIPTEVQLAALPVLMGEPVHLADDNQASSILGENGPIDLLAVAPTGSGKTLAFLIPILKSLFDDRARKEKAEKNGPQALIVAPTRELANQIVNEARKLAMGTGIRVTLVKKGMVVGTHIDLALKEREYDEASEISEGTEDEKDMEKFAVQSDVIVSTPLAITHALERRDKGTATLPSIRHLVLDEADVLLDELFRQQTMSVWDACTNQHLRTSLWSATMASSIESLAVSTISSRYKHDSEPKPSIIRLVIGLKDSALPTVTHKLVYAATETGKLHALRQLLHPTAPSSKESYSLNASSSNGASTILDISALRPPFLVFTQTIPRAIALHSELRYDIPPEAGGSARIAVLHSGLSETARSRVMASFRRGEVWVLITTDLLARGVDFRGLNGVVNYDVPTSAAAYVHRAGRTGRAGRRGGVAVTLYTKEDVPYMRNVVNVVVASGEGSSVPGWLRDVLPVVSKRDRKKLKRRGVEIRRPGAKGVAVISTKTPKDRQRGRWRKGEGGGEGGRKGKNGADDEVESEFEGFEV